MKRRYLYLAALWAGLIFALSSQPGSAVGLPPPWDKLAHMSAYAILALLLRAGGLRPGAAWWLAVLYGAGDELHQHFVPGRLADPADLAADALGALAAFLWGRIG
ncbi:MAG TPA: VanZ family protein [Oceanithermus profundus]|uniref:VanZ family protein n=1 Tax=Oceanithermus profundus TaxID=187137 RepID=A0A7C4ZHG7_9DEIN|nr:VanZ family protein [Oceanithermus profundus]